VRIKYRRKILTKRQDKKVFNRILQFILIFMVFSLMCNIFGKDSVVTNFYKEKVILTPYNLVGVIMIVFALFGFWIGKKKGSILLTIVTFLFDASAITSFSANFINYFSEQKIITTESGVDYGFKWVNVVAIIIIIALALCLVFAIFCLLKNIKIKREKTSEPSIINEFCEEQICSDEKLKGEQEQKIINAIKKTKEYKIGNKICPTCGAPMKLRQNRTNGSWFVGCQKYFTLSKCKFTYNYSKYKKLEEMYNVQDNILLERYYSGQIKIYLEFDDKTK